MALLQALVSWVSLLRLLVYLSGSLRIWKYPRHLFTISIAFLEGVLSIILPQPRAPAAAQTRLLRFIQPGRWRCIQVIRFQRSFSSAGE